MAANAFALSRDSLHETVIAGVGSVAFRLWSKDFHIEIKLDGVSGNAEVFKAGAEEADGGHVSDERMICRYLGNDSVAGHHIEHIEIFNDSGGQGVPAVAGLGVEVACDLGVGGPEGDNSLEPIVFGTLRKVSPMLAEFHITLRFDFVSEWKNQRTGKSGCFRVVDVLSRTFLGH